MTRGCKGNGPAAGVILEAKRETLDEALDTLLLGTSKTSWTVVERVEVGTTVFLCDWHQGVSRLEIVPYLCKHSFRSVSTYGPSQPVPVEDCLVPDQQRTWIKKKADYCKAIHGAFEAVSPGILNLNPLAFGGSWRGSPFPAQVKVDYYYDFPPVPFWAFQRVPGLFCKGTLETDRLLSRSQVEEMYQIFKTALEELEHKQERDTICLPVLPLPNSMQATGSLLTSHPHSLLPVDPPLWASSSKPDSGGRGSLLAHPSYMSHGRSYGKDNQGFKVCKPPQNSRSVSPSSPAMQSTFSSGFDDLSSASRARKQYRAGSRSPGGYMQERHLVPGGFAPANDSTPQHWLDNGGSSILAQQEHQLQALQPGVKRKSKAFRKRSLVKVPSKVKLMNPNDCGSNTTVFLGNIPEELTADMAVDSLDQSGFYGAYDFIFFKPSRGTFIGHIILNLTSEELAEAIFEEIDRVTEFWPHFRSPRRQKPVRWFRHQGHKHLAEAYPTAVTLQGYPSSWAIPDNQPIFFVLPPESGGIVNEPRMEEQALWNNVSASSLEESLGPSSEAQFAGHGVPMQGNVPPWAGNAGPPVQGLGRGTGQKRRYNVVQSKLQTASNKSARVAVPVAKGPALKPRPNSRPAPVPKAAAAKQPPFPAKQPTATAKLQTPTVQQPIKQNLLKSLEELRAEDLARRLNSALGCKRKAAEPSSKPAASKLPAKVQSVAKSGSAAQPRLQPVASTTESNRLLVRANPDNLSFQKEAAGGKRLFAPWRQHARLKTEAERCSGSPQPPSSKEQQPTSKVAEPSSVAAERFAGGQSPPAAPLGQTGPALGSSAARLLSSAAIAASEQILQEAEQHQSFPMDQRKPGPFTTMEVRACEAAAEPLQRVVSTSSKVAPHLNSIPPKQQQRSTISGPLNIESMQQRKMAATIDKFPTTRQEEAQAEVQPTATEKRHVEADFRAREGSTAKPPWHQPIVWKAEVAAANAAKELLSKAHSSASARVVSRAAYPDAEQVLNSWVAQQTGDVNPGPVNPGPAGDRATSSAEIPEGAHTSERTPEGVESLGSVHGGDVEPDNSTNITDAPKADRPDLQQTPVKGRVKKTPEFAFGEDFIALPD